MLTGRNTHWVSGGISVTDETISINKTNTKIDMNNNDKLKTWLRKNPNRSTLSANATDIACAGKPQLEKWVIELGGDPEMIYNTEYTKTSASTPVTTPVATPVASTEVSDAERIKILQDMFGSSSDNLDTDKVEQIVRSVMDTEILPTIDQLKDDVKELAPLASTLKEIADIMKTKTSARLPVATAVASGNNPMLEKVAPYYTAGETCCVPVCISAPPSYGKSYSVEILGKQYETFVQHGCNGSEDEFASLQGGFQPDSKTGGWKVVDGKLAQAVRSASEGNNTLFFFDEAFRMHSETAENLLQFLAPQPDEDGDDVYQLYTKHSDGSNLELLQCKADKLHIICATNLCEIEPPEALMSRFLIKHVQYETKMIEYISESVAKKFGIANPTNLAKLYAKAMGESRKMRANGQILLPLCIRTLKRACMVAKDATDESVREWIRDESMDAMLMWNSDTGDVTEDSVAGVRELAKILS